MRSIYAKSKNRHLELFAYARQIIFSKRSNVFCQNYTNIVYSLCLNNTTDACLFAWFCQVKTVLIITVISN